MDFIIGLIFILLLYIYLTWTFNHWKNKGVKYVTPTILFGNMFSLLFMKKSMKEFFDDFYNECKDSDLIGIWIFRRPGLVIKNPEIIKSVLVKDFGNFYDRTSHADAKYDPLGFYNLFLIKNPQWKCMRMKLNPIFTTKKMRMMFTQINTVGGEMMEYIKHKICQEKNSCVELQDLYSKFTVDSIASVAFGIEANSMKDPNALFLNLAKTMFDFQFYRALEMVSIFFAPDIAKLFKFKFFSSKCSDTLRSVFTDVIKKRETNPIERNDLINTLIGLKNDDNDNQIKFVGDTLLAQAAVFFSAGFETTRNSIVFTLYEITKQMDIQDKLYEDVSQALKKYGGEITYDAIHDMSYLDLCLKETLRKYPAIGFLDRYCQNTYKIPGDKNITIDAGTLVYIPISGLHMDPEYFPDPERYDPERFSAENIKNITPFTYLPFGEGPRVCIGMRLGLLQAKLGIVHIVKTFQLLKTSDTPDKITLNLKSFTIAPLHPLKINLKLRMK